MVAVRGVAAFFFPEPSGVAAQRTMYHIWGCFSITHNCWLFIKCQFVRTWPKLTHTHTPNEWQHFYRCIAHKSTHSRTTVSVNRHHKQTPFRRKTTVNVEAFSVDGDTKSSDMQYVTIRIQSSNVFLLLLQFYGIFFYIFLGFVNNSFVDCWMNTLFEIFVANFIEKKRILTTKSKRTEYDKRVAKYFRLFLKFTSLTKIATKFNRYFSISHFNAT